MPSGWFKKNRKAKKKAEECNIVEADLQNCALDELPPELYQHASTLQIVRLNSNNLTSLPTVSPPSMHHTERTLAQQNRARL